MLTVDDYGAIRRARRDGKSIRRIAREFDHSRNTVRNILKHPEPGPATRDRTAPLLGPVLPVIDQVLRDDEDAPPKQRHTAAQLFRRGNCQMSWTGDCQAAGCFLTPSTKAVPLMTSGRSVAPFNVRHFFDADSISL